MKSVFLRRLCQVTVFSTVTNSAVLLGVLGSLAGQAMADQVKPTCASVEDTVVPAGQDLLELPEEGLKGITGGSPVSIDRVSREESLFEITYDWGKFLNEIGEQDWTPSRMVTWSTHKFSLTKDDQVKARTLDLARLGGLSDVKVYDLNYSNCTKRDFNLSNWNNATLVEKHRLVIATRADGTISYKLVVIDASTEATLFAIELQPKQ